jgi:60 kDa SS-A/Ro ribonucleoprotein
MSYDKLYNPKVTPQSETIPGRDDMVANSAGGYTFAVDQWTLLDRFLILGSDQGSYYASARELTKDCASNVVTCLNSDGPRTVARIVEISTTGRAPRNDPALFALAMAAGHSDLRTKKAAFEALPKVARIGTHLFQFVKYAENFRGWGRLMRNAVAKWYQDKDPENLALQLAKYQQREGWSHRDLLRLSKPVPTDNEHDALYAWAVGKAPIGPGVIEGMYKAQEATDVREVGRIITEYNLTREMVPTEYLTDKVVWGALLTNMPMTAMVRNLGNMSKVGLLTPMSAAENHVITTLGNENKLRGSRIHPVQILIAMKTYAQGQGFRGKGTWDVCPRVTDALNDAFYKSFEYVQPTGKRHLLGIDVSGSMSGYSIANTPLSAAEGAAAMAMTIANTEPQYYAFGFCDQFVDLGITPNQRLDDILRKTRHMNFGNTDCALPMLYALKKGIEADVFVVITDNETWAGRIHPVQALARYRKQTGIAAKLIVIGMVSNGFTIADPKDAGMLDVVGFDASAPKIVADFAR